LTIHLVSDAIIKFTGTPAVVSLEACNLLAASDGDRVSICPLCESRVANMRNHIGQHILHALSSTPEEVALKEPVSFLKLHF
jgi:hypothetical protein